VVVLAVVKVVVDAVVVGELVVAVVAVLAALGTAVLVVGRLQVFTRVCLSND